MEGRSPRSSFIRSVALCAILLLATALFVLMGGGTHRAVERARITVQEATILGPLVQHNVPTATVLLRNTGNSVAQAARARLVMTVWTSPTFPDWKIPLQLTTDIRRLEDIDAGSSLSQTVSLIAPLSDIQGIHLERKDWFIVILGVVAYTDGTGTPHETHLCLIWSDPSQDRLSPCEKWNEAT